MVSGRAAALPAGRTGRLPPIEADLLPVTWWGPCALGVFSSFAGFHVAGLVEYNFGNSEVLEIFFVTMGLGLVVDETTRRNG